jgi:hypothetical protein
MTQNEIIGMAEQAGMLYMDYIRLESMKQIEALIKLATDKERDACAKVAGEFAQKWWSIHCHSNKHMETTRKAHDDFCALQSAIRARGQA